MGSEITVMMPKKPLWTPKLGELVRLKEDGEIAVFCRINDENYFTVIARPGGYNGYEPGEIITPDYINEYGGYEPFYGKVLVWNDEP